MKYISLLFLFSVTCQADPCQIVKENYLRAYGHTEENRSQANDLVVKCRILQWQRQRLYMQAMGQAEIGSPDEYANVDVEHWSDKSELDLVE